MTLTQTIKSFTSPAVLGLGVLLTFSPLSAPVHAESFLCEATQASSKELPQLASSCPIGKGHWSKKAPKQEHDFYWIQCGLLPKPMALNTAKPIYKNISTDVWVKPEDKGYRCLIGPYTDYAKAAEELKGVRSVAAYREAFIRKVGDGSQAVKAATTAKVEAPKVEPQPRQEKIAKAAPVATMAAPAPAPAPAPAVEPVSIDSAQTGIEVRLQTTVSGKVLAVPFLMDGGHQFYMEHGKPWTRLSYEQSEQVCSTLGMRLAKADEFVALRDSNVMQSDEWPMHLPYWGKDRYGLFMEREPSKLTGNSLLNVLCVKP